MLSKHLWWPLAAHAARRDLRLRALQELRAVVEGGYRGAGKQLQAAVFDDLMAAACLRDRCGCVPRAYASSRASATCLACVLHL